MNQVIIVGRLGANPESRAIQGGSVCNFSVATSESYSGRNGKAEERTEWHRIIVYGKLAEVCMKYLTKGCQVLVEGKIQTRSWVKDNGSKHSLTEIVASTVKFLDLKGPSNGEIPY